MYEIIVWVNEEGSMTTYRETFAEAIDAKRDMVTRARNAGWKVTGTEINPRDAGMAIAS